MTATLLFHANRRQAEYTSICARGFIVSALGLCRTDRELRDQGFGERGTKVLWASARSASQRGSKVLTASPPIVRILGEVQPQRRGRVRPGLHHQTVVTRIYMFWPKRDIKSGSDGAFSRVARLFSISSREVKLRRSRDAHL